MSVLTTERHKCMFRDCNLEKKKNISKQSRPFCRELSTFNPICFALHKTVCCGEITFQTAGITMNSKLNYGPQSATFHSMRVVLELKSLK